MKTSEILERLYGINPRRRGPKAWARRVLRRATHWVQDHNWSLILISTGVCLWILTHIYYYNSLVSLEFDVLAARAQIEASQQKRSHIQRNVVGLLRYYESYERQLMTDVTEMRSHADLPPPPSVGDDSMGSLIGRLNAVAEQYPALRLTEMVHRIAEAVIAIESEIAIRIAQYNTAVNIYTTVLKQFPGVLFAGTLGFEDMPFWQSTEPELLPYRAMDL